MLLLGEARSEPMIMYAERIRGFNEAYGCGSQPTAQPRAQRSSSTRGGTPASAPAMSSTRWATGQPLCLLRPGTTSGATRARAARRAAPS
eukprot:6726181-Alexandrium_andersonii.AAC.1